MVLGGAQAAMQNAPVPESDRRLRIVTPRFGEAVLGGAEWVARELALRLAAAGWAVEVWTTCAVDAVSWRNQEPAGTSADGAVIVRRYPTRLHRPPRLFHQLSRVLFRLPSRLRPERLWVALQGPYAPGLVRALAAAPPAPTLFLPYLYHPALRGAPRSRGARLLMPAAHEERPLGLRAVARLVDAVDGFLYATPEERALLESAHPAAAGRAWRVGNVGIEAPPAVDPERARARLGLSGPYLLHAGRAATGKGIDELLTAAGLLRRTHPEVSLVLAGEAGAALPAGAVAGPGVVRVGMLERPALWDAVAGAAAVVVPSFLESQSLLAVEAWAVGRPALLNAASPALAGQAGRSGGAILYRGAAELAAAAAGLLDDPDRAAALGASGRRWVEARYRWTAVLDGVRELVAEAELRASLRRD
jgi:glycosyltransferase involved in cell wall biosynthesis